MYSFNQHDRTNRRLGRSVLSTVKSEMNLFFFFFFNSYNEIVWGVGGAQ